jgi:hypothetical protein
VHAVLRTRQFSGPNRFGYYTVTFPDGVEFELSAKGLDGTTEFTGCAFHLRSMSCRLPEFIFEPAKGRRHGSASHDGTSRSDSCITAAEGALTSKFA